MAVGDHFGQDAPQLLRPGVEALRLEVLFEIFRAHAEEVGEVTHRGRCTRIEP
jgi:hypothetical protein